MSRFIASALFAIACVAAPAAEEAKPAEAAAKPYPLATCIVSDEALDSMGGAIVKVYAGQEVKFCCKGCVKKFEKAQPEYLKKLDAPAKAEPAPAAAKP